MRLYFQHPPTGEFPCLGLDFYEKQGAYIYVVDTYPNNDLNTELEVFEGWFGIDSPEYSSFACFSPKYGFLHIPSFNIRGETFDQVVELVEKIISERPNPDEGSFGIWSRGFYQLLRDCFDVDLGIVWHPDPTAFERCQAQADLDSRTWEGRKLDGDLRWKPVTSIRELLKIAFVRNPRLNHAYQP